MSPRLKSDEASGIEPAKKVSTSIPQIRRDFTERFSNGYNYLEAAGRKFDQPTHYARKIMELQELYDDHVLNRFIGIAVAEDKMDIKSFRSLLRNYNSEQCLMGMEEQKPNEQPVYQDEDSFLTRDCSYYELNLKEVISCNRQ